MNLKIKLFKSILTNPLFLPSGIITDIPSHKKAVDAGVGLVVLKSITVEKRDGYPIPRVINYPHGTLNAVGLRNPGIKIAKKEVKDFLISTNTPVVVSLFANNAINFETLVSEIAPLKPTAIELNLSCPHVQNEFGKMVSSDTQTAGLFTKKTKKVALKIPIICKLSPNTSNIADVAKACETAGADAIAAINTVGPGMVIDIKKRKPILGNLKGGVSGAGIKPIAIAKIYDVYEAVKIPILGMGGVSSYEDVIEMMLAGATIVGIGSAIYIHGYSIYQKIIKELENYLVTNNIKNIKSLIGAAH